jgi:hypothetical protein
LRECNQKPGLSDADKKDNNEQIDALIKSISDFSGDNTE